MATIQEYRSVDTVSHPAISFHNFWHSFVGSLKDLLKVVKVIPRLEESCQVRKAKIFHRLLFIISNGAFGLV